MKKIIILTLPTLFFHPPLLTMQNDIFSKKKINCYELLQKSHKITGDLVVSQLNKLIQSFNDVLNKEKQD